MLTDACFNETCHRVDSNSRQRRRNQNSTPLDHRGTMATPQMAYINFSKMAYFPDFWEIGEEPNHQKKVCEWKDSNSKFRNHSL